MRPAGPADGPHQGLRRPSRPVRPGAVLGPGLPAQARRGHDLRDAGGGQRQSPDPTGPKRRRGSPARAAGHRLRDGLRALTGGAPHLVPMVGEPAPTRSSPRRAGRRRTARSRARVDATSCARTALEAGFNRPIRWAARVSCPLLVRLGPADDQPGGGLRAWLTRHGRSRALGVTGCLLLRIV